MRLAVLRKPVLVIYTFLPKTFHFVFYEVWHNICAQGGLVVRTDILLQSFILKTSHLFNFQAIWVEMRQEDLNFGKVPQNLDYYTCHYCFSIVIRMVSVLSFTMFCRALLEQRDICGQMQRTIQISFIFFSHNMCTNLDCHTKFIL